MAEPAEAPETSQHLRHTLLAVFWMYGSRGFGMLWTLALVSRLGVADYGKYAMAYAVYAMIGPPLDNPFAVRSVRESEDRFLAERTTRYLLGVALMVAGVSLVQVNYIAWFGLFVAGGELTLKALQSRTVRDGQPHKAAQFDTARQVGSVVMACGYLFLAAKPNLQVASMFLASPYVVIAVVFASTAVRHRPGIPGNARLIAILIGETLGLAIYLQGDLLLLGWLTNETTAGYYGLCTTVTIAIVAVGQSFGMSYNQTLRAGAGDLTAGPPLKNTLILGALAGMLVLITAVVMLLVPRVPEELAVAMLIMSLFCAMRTVSSVFQAVLYNQRRDGIRLAANLGLVPVKLGLVALLAPAGAVGAATATVITDAILLAAYARTLYGKARS